MANYYVSSTAYAAVSQWAASHAYSVGDIVRQLAAPAVNSERCFRCTTAGTSGATEPAWVLTNSATTTSGTAVFTECTGQEAHQHDNGVTTTWTAPAARLGDLNSFGKGIVANGDTVFFSSDHAETQSTAYTLRDNGSAASPCFYLSVDRTSANLPPLAAQITAGASFAATGTATVQILQAGQSYWFGCTFDASGTTGSFTIGAAGANVLDTCTIKPGVSVFGLSADMVFKNVTVALAASSTGFISAPSSRCLRWYGGAISGSTSAALFSQSGSQQYWALDIEGVDLSSQTGSIFTANASFPVAFASFRNCKINASATLFNTSGNAESAFLAWNFQGGVEFINCASGNDQYHDAWYKYAGEIDTETTITRTSGATDGVQKRSRKLVSNANAGFLAPLFHDIFVWNTITGASKTATVEFISSATLNNDDIWGELEYLGDAASCKASFANDYRATVLTTHAAQGTSTAAWDSSPATPQKQNLAIGFTAQKVGLLRFRVYLAKASTTVYVDPMITVA